ncbi:MAG: spore germination protein [Firmicutes bacterium]|nr:spore germination protein [Bacillota bacterium]
MKGRISWRQLRRLQMLIILPTTVVFLPGAAFTAARAGALWAVSLAAALAFLVNAAVAWAVVGWGPPRLFRDAFGKKVARLALGTYGMCVMVALISIWNELLSFVSASVLPRTPEWAVGAFILAAVIPLVQAGPEGLARISDLLTMTGLLFSGVLLFSAVAFIRPENYLPWWPQRPLQIVQGAVMPLSFLGESVIGVAFLPYCRPGPPQPLRRAIVEGALWCSGVLLATVAVVWGELGTNYAAHGAYPVLEAMREVRGGEFFSRLDLIYVPVWLGLIELKLGIWTFVATDATRRALGLSPRPWLAFAIGASTLAAATLGFPTVQSRLHFIVTSWTTSLFPALVLLFVSAGLLARRKAAKT